MGDFNCDCGHPKSAHRKNGICKKCKCTGYSMAPHNVWKCNCPSCLRQTINHNAQNIQAIKDIIDNELMPISTKLKEMARSIIEDIE